MKRSSLLVFVIFIFAGCLYTLGTVQTLPVAWDQLDSVIDAQGNLHVVGLSLENLQYIKINTMSWDGVVDVSYDISAIDVAGGCVNRIFGSPSIAICENTPLMKMSVNRIRIKKIKVILIKTILILMK